jgi:hypothetical protein
MSKPLVFFRNYDYTENSTGPGIGAYRMTDKNISDFRKRKKRMKQRKKAYLQIVAGTDNNNLFDPYEAQDSNTMPYAPAEPSPIGMLDGIIPHSDLEGKSPSNFYYGIMETHFADDLEEDETNEDEEEDPKPTE